MAEKKEQNAEKLKALQLTIDKLEKTYGKGSIMKLGDRAVVDVESIPSGSVALDVALGVGGYPRGRIVEIYGPESSGKTTLTIHAIAEVQKQGGIAAFIDAEHAFDQFYAESLGVDTENLFIYNNTNYSLFRELQIPFFIFRHFILELLLLLHFFFSAIFPPKCL